MEALLNMCSVYIPLLKQEGNMPLEELLAIYRYEGSAGSSIDSSSGDLTDELPDMTLDKVTGWLYSSFTILSSPIH